MIYVDSCVPMYLIGADHPHKKRTVELVSSLLSAREEFITSAEAFQEIIHRFKALHDFKNLDIAYEAFEEMIQQIFPIMKQDCDLARTIVVRYPALSSRDCLHLAVMRRIGCTRIWSYDTSFDMIPKVVRVY